MPLCLSLCLSLSLSLCVCVCLSVSVSLSCQSGRTFVPSPWASSTTNRPTDRTVAEMVNANQSTARRQTHPPRQTDRQRGPCCVCVRVCCCSPSEKTGPDECVPAPSMRRCSRLSLWRGTCSSPSPAHPSPPRAPCLPPHCRHPCRPNGSSRIQQCHARHLPCGDGRAGG